MHCLHIWKCLVFYSIYAICQQTAYMKFSKYGGWINDFSLVRRGPIIDQNLCLCVRIKMLKCGYCSFQKKLAKNFNDNFSDRRLIYYYFSSDSVLQSCDLGENIQRKWRTQSHNEAWWVFTLCCTVDMNRPVFSSLNAERKSQLS